MDEGKSSYHFTPKAPENWSVKIYDRRGRKVRLVRMKPWQLQAFSVLKDARLGLMRAFCGAGKTIAARGIGAHKIFVHGKRQVFCVPKNDIGNDGFANFFDIEIPWKGGRKRVANCEKPLNFCSPRSSSKINELIGRLCRDPVKDDSAGDSRIVSSMQVVVTHQCLTLAFRKIRKDPRKFAKFIANNTFWIDEGHHIKGHDESAEEKATMNLLGKFVNELMEMEGQGAELLAMTATPYRGDYSRLFSSRQMDDFKTYSLDFLDHFPTLGIERVDMELEVYSDIDDVVQRVARNIGEEVDKKHLVFVPPTGRKWRSNRRDVDRLFKAIHEEIMRNTGCDLETAKSQVLDLVTESAQKANQKLLRQEPKSGDEHPSRFKVVVACMLCREGSDWCPADRIHNTSMEHSPPVIFQTNGRLFRHFPGKREVKIRYYIEKFKNIAAGRREFVSDRVNYVLHYMLMDDMLNPIVVSIPPFKSEKNKESGPKRNRTTLEEVFSHQYQDMKRFLVESLADIEFNERAVDQIISQAMENYLPKNRNFNRGHQTQIRMALKAFLLRCRSSDLRNEGVDVSFIRENGFDEVVERKGIGSNMYTSSLTLKELKRFRETVAELCFTQEQTGNICEGLRNVAARQFGKRDEGDQGYLVALKSAYDEFDEIHAAYKKSAKTKDFTPRAVANMVKKPLEHVEKMIGLFNKFCFDDTMRFDFKKDSALARKVVPLGRVA